MSTTFGVTKDANTKGVEARAFTVDLGQDILDGVSETMRDEKAAASIRIDVQGPLRKLAKTVDEALDMEIHLQKTYPNATVTNGIVKAPSEDAEVKGLIRKHGAAKIDALLEKILAGEVEID